MGFKIRQEEDRTVGTRGTGPAMPNKPDVQSTLAEIGGFDCAKHMAIAAKAVYLQTIGGVRDHVRTNPEIWPKGWRVVGDGWYGLSDEVRGNRTAGLLPNLESKHAVTVLEWVASGIPGHGFQKGDIMIACRGTDFGLSGFTEGAVDLMAMKSDFKHPVTGKYVGKVHTGFWDIYNSVFLGKISGSPSLFEAVLKRKPKHVYVTGHSLGGAMSHLAAIGLDLMARKLDIPSEIRVCSFAAPRVCNCQIPPSRMYHAFKNSAIKGIRVVNTLDPVAFLSGASGVGSLVTAALSTAAANFKGNPSSVLKSFGVATVGTALASIAEVGNVLHGVATGIWDHPDFSVVTYSDSGRSAGAPHPHSMDLYQKVMLEQAPRLDC